MPLKTQTIDRSLTSKGFEKIERDHHYYHFKHDGRKTALTTKTSHGKSEIDDSLIALMSRQLKLSKKEFMTFVECRLSESDYIELMQQRGFL